MKYRNLIIALVLSLTATAAIADPYVLRLGRPAGLSNNYINGIAQDRNGHVWLSTESGLNRYDGSGFTSFKAGSGTIAANELNRIVIDSTRNILWICTQRFGLDALDCDTYQVTNYQYGEDDHSLASNGVTDVAVAPEGKVWVATYTDGLDLLDPETGKVTHYNSSTISDWPDDKLWTVTTDSDGMVYIGHVDSGFSILNPAKREITNFRPVSGDACSLPGLAVRAVFIDHHDNIGLAQIMDWLFFIRPRGLSLSSDMTPVARPLSFPTMSTISAKAKMTGCGSRLKTAGSVYSTSGTYSCVPPSRWLSTT